MDPMAGNTQKDDKVLPPNNIIVLSNRRQDENVGTSAGMGNTLLPLSHQNISEIVTAVIAAAFQNAQALPEGQYAASQPVTGYSYATCLPLRSIPVLCLALCWIKLRL